MHTDRRPRVRTVIVLLLFATSGLAAETRVTVSQARLHAAPRAGSRVIAIVPAGVRLSVDCSKSWCSTSWNGAAAWVAKRDVSAPNGDPGKQKTTGRGYINSDGKRIPSPQLSPSGPPAGATAQCNDGSYSFSRHRSGTCSHHGGVRQWL
ncbi:MAG TPA: DUF3761 domain-containing protein [Thermoanaerobaculia bacterium]|nr:DUF3761 domain-containing protein [Thermoanaerobaculia bacterium]